MLLGDAFDAEQDLCDLALAGAMLAGVDGAQHHLEASSLLCCHALIGRNAVAGQVTQQAIEGGDAIETVAVERDRNRYPIVGPNRGIGDQMQARADLVQEEMEFVWRDPLLTGKEGAQGDGSLPGGRQVARQPQNSGVGGLTPEDRLVACRQTWPGREIAAPSGSPSVRGAACQGCLRVADRDNLADSRRSGADTPRRDGRRLPRP